MTDVQPKISDIIIDPEFEKLCPPLSADEYQQLLISIEQEGFRDEILVWNSPKGALLLDGHNRYRIWQTVYDADPKKAPRLKSYNFPSRDDAERLAIRCQLGRRNVTNMVRVELAMRLEPLIAKKAREHQSTAGRQPGTLLLAERSKAREPINTRAEIAKLAGVSEKAVQNTKRVLASGDEKLIEATRKGDVKLGTAVAMLEKAKPAAKRVESEDGFLHEASELFKSTLDDISTAIKSITSLAKTEHGQFVDYKRLIKIIGNAGKEVQRAQPTKECPLCHTKGCNRCRKVGYVSGLLFRQLTDGKE